MQVPSGARCRPHRSWRCLSAKRTRRHRRCSTFRPAVACFRRVARRRARYFCSALSGFPVSRIAVSVVRGRRTCVGMVLVLSVYSRSFAPPSVHATALVLCLLFTTLHIRRDARSGSVGSLPAQRAGDQSAVHCAMSSPRPVCLSFDCCRVSVLRSQRACSLFVRVRSYWCLRVKLRLFLVL